MRKILSIRCCIAVIISFFISLNGQSQETYNYVEQMPEPIVNINKFLNEHVVYPPDARQAGIEGKAIIKFIIDSLGNVLEPKVVRSVHPSLDSESVRVIRLLPKWIPGKQNGKNVNTYYTLPITFKLEEQRLLELFDSSGKIVIEYADKIPAPKFNLENYIKQNMIPPEEYKNGPVKGNVKIKVLISEEGKVLKSQVVGTVYHTLDSEAVRLVNNMPSWSPAVVNGKVTAAYFPVVVRFYNIGDESIVNQKDSLQVVDTAGYAGVTSMPKPSYSVSQFLAQNLRYPNLPKYNNIIGRSTVTFIVDETGQITYVHTKNPIDFYLDTEARRVIEKMPPWKPGLNNGKPVKVYFTQTIKFEIN